MPEIHLELASEDVRKLDTEVDLLGFSDRNEYLRWIIGNRAAIEQGTERDQLLTEYQARVDELEAELDEQGAGSERAGSASASESTHGDSATGETSAGVSATGETSAGDASDGDAPAVESVTAESSAGESATPARATDRCGTRGSSGPSGGTLGTTESSNRSSARTEQATFASTPPMASSKDDASDDAASSDSVSDDAASSDGASTGPVSNATSTEETTTSTTSKTVSQVETASSDDSESEPELVAATAASGNSVATNADLGGNFTPERVERFEDESLGSHADRLKGVEGERLDEFARRAVAKTRERLGREPATGLEYRSGTRIARSSPDVRPGEDLVDLDSLDVPGRSEETCAPRREAVGAALAYLRDVGRAKRSDFVEELYEEYPAGYDSSSGWWRCMKRGLKDAPVVDGGDGSRVWRYRPPGSREGELVGAGPKRIVDPD